jgi:hypothetical protein
VYRIYNYGGTLDNQTLELGAIPNSQDKSNIFVQTSIDKQVNLVNANGVTLQFWDGATVNQSHGASGIEGDSKLTVAMANGWQSAVRVITTGPPQPVRVTPLGTEVLRRLHHQRRYRYRG